jgi:TonB family protein
MHVLLAAVLAAALALPRSAAQEPAPKTPPAPDCQKLLMTGAGPGVMQLCQGETEMRLAAAAAADPDERRKRLASAAAEFERAAGSLRDLNLKIYAVEALIRLFGETNLNEPREVEQALRLLIPLMPGNSSPLRRIANLEEAQGLIDAAENTLLTARQQVPDDVEVYRALSQFYGRRAQQISTANVPQGRHGEPVVEPQSEPVAEPQREPAAERQSEPNAPSGGPDAEGYYSIGGDIPPPAPMSPRVPAQRSPEADAAGVTGIVVVEIRIDETGGVTGAKIVRSVPLLDESAVAAVKEWRFAPTIVEGRAVPVKMTVTVNFAPPK